MNTTQKSLIEICGDVRAGKVTARSRVERGCHGGAVGGFHHLNGIGRQAGGGEAGTHAGRDGLVGIQRLRPATQYAGVAGLHAQAGGVSRHVGA